ncbi:MAG: NUDIX domain-containing protein [Ruminococcaceae bacterium]|nr:NUDIX domain-containing protein [Oscillospiraceae bacterium]
MDNKNYIKWIRSKVGHEKIILVFAGGCVFNEKGEILLQKRGDFNKWGFPGGAVELGEAPEDTAVREVKEETGLDVKIDRLIGVYSEPDFVYPNGDTAHSICIAYEMHIIGGALSCDGDESTDLKFFPLKRTPALFCKQHEDLMADIKTHKNHSSTR